ncbi:translocation/assembly module TamB domain-containing protein [Erythrobacter sp. sf7]|uniref:Translocation/assembly module TamB domain-containing protein n=1 Tax=Erythrobacter fulvus TaxID=2987523 RepID=A0ABT5JPP2_9SPHN|nr:translocation/assembly module TamB domain-containing protein [Erythrobacter fulvus]MDC8754093.1 translocation/assembly module TamB domain-containing protein [Erythrobacter fulvus]
MSSADDLQPEELDHSPPARAKRRWAKRLGWALALLIAPLVLVAGFFATPIGKRFIADQIAAVAPASGLRFAVGRIEGDVFGKARLRDVRVSDPEGVFLTIPEVALDWRPLGWLWSGLDIREVIARRGRLERLPTLLPGDPDAPLLPDFDIRVDKFAIEDLVIAKGVATARDEKADLQARIDIRKGRALIDAKAQLGAGDRIAVLLDAEPDGDRFDLAADYRAPVDGVLAGLAGFEAGYTAHLAGDGTWQRWRGTAVARRLTATGAADSGAPAVAAFRITNEAGMIGILGRLRPQLAGEGVLARALGPQVALAASFTLDDSVVEGRSAVVTQALDLRAAGVVDLADNRVEGARTSVVLRDPDLLGAGWRFEDARLAADVTGAFRDLGIEHRLTVGRLEASGVEAEQLVQEGLARFDGTKLSVPLALTAARVTTGNPQADPRLVQGRVTGTLVYDSQRQTLSADAAQIAFPGLAATLALRGDIPAGAYALAGPVSARGLAVDGAGEVTATAKILAKFGPSVPWSLRANLAGVLDKIGNATIVNLAGDEIRFAGALGVGADQPLVLRDVAITGERIEARLDSKVVPGSAGARTTLSGSGRQADYGPFTIDAEFATDGPRAVLVLADPYPAAGLEDVRIALAPADEGFALDVSGGSLLGPFDGALGLVLPESGPTRIAVDRLNIYRTRVSGGLVLGEDGVSGDLALAGGGLDGTLSLRPQSGDAIGFAVDLKARNAAFGGAVPISIDRATIAATGRYAKGDTRVDADISTSGFEYGALYLASLTANADIANGRGKVTGGIAGKRADRFALSFDADVAPSRIAAVARGQYGGSQITMPRRAVLTAQDGGGWQLAQTQIGFARGYALVEGALGGEETALEIKLARMPLRLLDLAGADLGLGGRLSGIIDYRRTGNAAPTAKARVKIDNFSRSGLVLSSRPVGVLGVIDLDDQRLTAAGRLTEGEQRLGDIALRITDFPDETDLGRRLLGGRLQGRLMFEGAAETLWRLAAVEAFDLTGPVTIAARATGTLADPRITGTLATEDLTVSSGLTGTRIEKVRARGTFAGSRLQLTRFAGSTAGGGTVTGSGIVDLAGMSATRGPGIDLKAAVNGARLLDANGLEATITGPLRIVSNGLGGTIAGRVKIDRARWELGVAAEDVALPQIATREINGEDGRARQQVSARDTAWRYLVNASAPSRVTVEGMGLESEWGIDIALRGTVNDPRIGGTARLVRGDYTFAGTRFELTRGRILFDENEPIDPRLDILAETSRSGTNVDIAITGNAQSPSIAFSSDPALPEEEILARLLFGGSVTSLSATDALQLAAALASLQGGGSGLDPIGELRRSIGLDQLRIVGADPLIGRETGVALGKNITRRAYVELVTDGQGYSATTIEYRITSWLALLGTVSTIGRDSVLVEVSRDY